MLLNFHCFASGFILTRLKASCNLKVYDVVALLYSLINKKTL